jgi:hypothetical protein
VASGPIYVQSSEVDGSGEYLSAGLGYSSSPIPISLSAVYYTPLQTHRYVPEGMNARKEHIDQMKVDIQSGLSSPAGTPSAYSRTIAILQLDLLWKTYENYFMFEYNKFQPPRER